MASFTLPKGEHRFVSGAGKKVLVLGNPCTIYNNYLSKMSVIDLRLLALVSIIGYCKVNPFNLQHI